MSIQGVRLSERPMVGSRRPSRRYAPASTATQRLLFGACPLTTIEVTALTLSTMQERSHSMDVSSMSGSAHYLYFGRAS
jgi:hypothetical protein